MVRFKKKKQPLILIPGQFTLNAIIQFRAKAWCSRQMMCVLVVHTAASCSLACLLESPVVQGFKHTLELQQPSAGARGNFLVGQNAGVSVLY